MASLTKSNIVGILTKAFAGRDITKHEIDAVAGMIAGALMLIGPTLLKTRLGVDEVVTTLLLNFIVILFVQMMLEGALKDPMSMGWPQSEPVIDSAILPPLIERMRVHLGLVIALICAVALAIGATSGLNLLFYGLLKRRG